MKQDVSLANASFAELCRIPRDHFDWANFSIMTDSCVVWLSEQKIGEQRKQHIEIPRGIFNNLVRKYLSEQRRGIQRKGKAR